MCALQEHRDTIFEYPPRYRWPVWVQPALAAAFLGFMFWVLTRMGAAATTYLWLLIPLAFLMLFLWPPLTIPRRLVVSEEGISVVTFAGRRSHLRWNDIVAVTERDSYSMQGPLRTLFLATTAGKRIGVHDTMPRYEGFRDVVREHLRSVPWTSESTLQAPHRPAR